MNCLGVLLEAGCGGGGAASARVLGGSNSFSAPNPSSLNNAHDNSGTLKGCRSVNAPSPSSTGDFRDNPGLLGGSRSFNVLIPSSPSDFCDDDSGGGSSSSAAPPPADDLIDERSPAETHDVWFFALQKRQAEKEKMLAKMAAFEAKFGWRISELGGRVGLRNLRNTCWLNAVVQSLGHVEPLVAAFLSSSWTCLVGGSPAPEGQVITGFRALLQDLWEERQAAVLPLRFHRCLAAKAPWVVDKRLRTQQDAQEFLLFILNVLDEECKAVSSEMARAEPDEIKVPSASQPAASSPITRLFQGQLESLVTCPECGHASRTHQDFLHLSVTVRERQDAGDSVTLNEALAAEFGTEERLGGDNRWLCDKCGVRVEAAKRVRLHRLPPVILLHLTRFAYSQADRALKVRTPVMLPTKDSESFGTVDFGRYLSSEPAQAEYDLVSVVNHYGRAAMAGHYTAHCRHCGDGQWYAFNDDKVSHISTSQVWLPGEAYIVCFVQRGCESRRTADLEQTGLRNLFRNF